MLWGITKAVTCILGIIKPEMHYTLRVLYGVRCAYAQPLSIAIMAVLVQEAIACMSVTTCLSLFFPTHMCSCFCGKYTCPHCTAAPDVHHALGMQQPILLLCAEGSLLVLLPEDAVQEWFCTCTRCAHVQCCLNNLLYGLSGGGSLASLPQGAVADYMWQLCARRDSFMHDLMDMTQRGQGQSAAIVNNHS